MRTFSSKAPATPSRSIRRLSSWGSGDLTVARSAAHTAMLAVASTPLGFTVPARNNTMGVVAAATPMTAMRDRKVSARERTALASSAAETSPLRIRIRMTPVPEGNARLGQPTSR